MIQNKSYVSVIPAVPNEFYQLMQKHLTILNGTIHTPEELYQFSPEGILFYVTSKYGVDPYFIKARGAEDARTRLARLKLIDMIREQFDWKLSKIGDFIGRKQDYIFRAFEEIRGMKSAGAWPKEDASA